MMVMRRIGLLALSMALTAGCTTDNYPVPPLTSREEAPAYYKPPIEKDYRLQVGGALAIHSFFESQLNQEMVVRPDGRISVLLIGELSVAGMDNYLNGGKIKSPSLLQLDGDLTLLQAVARAVGFLPSANTGQILLLRNTDDGTLTVSKIDIDKSLRNDAPDVFLQRRDVVYLPKTGIAGKFVGDHINAIEPTSVQSQLGWTNTRAFSRNS